MAKHYPPREVDQTTAAERSSAREIGVGLLLFLVMAAMLYIWASYL